MRFDKIQFLPILLFAGISCTGIHISPHLGATNTNPAQEYGTIGVLFKGGGLYHDSTVAGQVGDAAFEKEGRACSHAVLWLFAWGDSGINTARLAGGITKISSVEYEITSLFGFFHHRFCTVVRGEP